MHRDDAKTRAFIAKSRAAYAAGTLTKREVNRLEKIPGWTWKAAALSEPQDANVEALKAEQAFYERHLNDMTQEILLQIGFLAHSTTEGDVAAASAFSTLSTSLAATLLPQIVAAALSSHTRLSDQVPGLAEGLKLVHQSLIAATLEPQPITPDSGPPTRAFFCMGPQRSE
jgi:hypothetical protein